MRYPEYNEGLNMSGFHIVKEISNYNSNYYIGLSPFDLLYADSDDDNTTEWYLVKNGEMIYLGESYMSDDNELNRYETPCT